MRRTLRLLALLSTIAGSVLLLSLAAYLPWIVLDHHGFMIAVREAGLNGLNMSALLILWAAVGAITTVGGWSYLRRRSRGDLLLTLSACTWLFLGASDVLERGLRASGVFMLALGLAIGMLQVLRTSRGRRIKPAR